MQTHNKFPDTCTMKELDCEVCYGEKPGLKEHLCLQHAFISSLPITTFYIYHDQRLCTAIKCLNPMSLVQCGNCGTKFISVVEGDITMGKSNNFEVTFAAYYNTSQLIGNANGT